MKALSLEEHKKGIRLTFVNEKLNKRNQWCMAIGETPFFWLVVERDCEGRVGSRVHGISKDEMIPFEEGKKDGSTEDFI